MLKIVKLVIDVNLQQCILPKIHEISGNNIQLIKTKKADRFVTESTKSPVSHLQGFVSCIASCNPI